MAGKLFSPPSPSPASRKIQPDSLYSTPVNRRALSSTTPSTIRAPNITRSADTIHGEQANPDEAADFLALHAQGRSHTHAFRVHSPTSAPASTLIWTGYPSSSGFFPYNAHLAISPSVYIKTLGLVPHNTPGWEHGPYVRHTMVDHINGKMRQGLLNIPSRLEERPGTPEDDKSPWISGTRSLVWAVWEVARRLAWGDEVVGIAVVRCVLADPVEAEKFDGFTDEVEVEGGGTELERWKKEDERLRRGYIGREVLINPLRPISNALGSGRGGTMSVSMREAYESAMRSARESEEVLWYGRVFAESIGRNIEFSHDHLPIELPGQFWRSTDGPARGFRNDFITPRKPSPWDRNGSYDGESDTEPASSWLTRLVWDPKHDNYERAMQKVVQRRRELYLNQGVPRDVCCEACRYGTSQADLTRPTSQERLGQQVNQEAPECVRVCHHVDDYA